MRRRFHASDEFRIRKAIHTIRRNAINFNKICGLLFYQRSTYITVPLRSSCSMRLHHCTLKSDRNNNNRKMKISYTSLVFSE
jgi:hypothetical protein